MADADKRSSEALVGSVYDHDGSAISAVDGRDADADAAELFNAAF